MSAEHAGCIPGTCRAGDQWQAVTCGGGNGGALTGAECEAIADAADAAFDFGETWIRFLRNGDESMLLPVVERIKADAYAAGLRRRLATAGQRRNIAELRAALRPDADR